MLMLAQLLKSNAPPYKGLPTDAAGKIAYAKGLWKKLIREHFRVEETLISDFVSDLGSEDLSAMWDTLAQEHRALQEQVEALDEVNPNAAAMDALGFALEKHIRTEERVFFQKLQEVAGDELQELDLSGGN